MRECEELADNKFLIIDGSSIVYRAFYALPLLQNKRGEHTNAVYGFTNMLLGILEKTNPDYGAVVFDRAAPTFRHVLYDDYKAHREETPSELREQIMRVKDIIDAYNFPVYELDGYEADDIIGALAKKADLEGMESLLFSGDTDLFQLISGTTRVIMVRRGITDLHEYDLARLWDRYSLTPEQMIDFKALKGDSSDNIPGVPGVGEKTALKLLYEYGSLDGILQSTADLKGKLKENLECYRKQALLSRELVKIKCDIEELDFSWEECRLSPPDLGRVRTLFEGLEFRTLMDRLPAVTTKGKAVTADLNAPALIPVTDLEQLKQIKKERGFNRQISFLAEAEREYPRWKSDPVAIAFAVDQSTGYYVHPSVISSGAWKTFMDEIFAVTGNDKVEVIGYNTKLLVNMLSELGITEPHPVFDAMLAAYLLDPGRAYAGRQRLLQEFINVELAISIPQKRNKNEDPEVIARSLAEEATCYFELKKVMENKIAEEGFDNLYYDMELPLSLVLSEMERQGICVNKEKLLELSAEIKSTIDRLQVEIYAMAGEEFNLNSPRQLAAILFEKLKMPVKKKTKTGFSTDVRVLEELAIDYEIADKLLHYRQLVKLEGTYLSGLLPYVDKESGKIYTTFNQTITTTGRLSSSEPNLQNIPVRLAEGRRIREAFIPSKEGYIFLAADYSQIELRVLAHLSQDPTLLQAFLNDEDIHLRTASEILGIAPREVTTDMRKKAKAVNFGIVYGISDYGLSQDLKVPRKEAKTYIESYFTRYYGVKNYMDEIVEKARNQGYVTTIFNRRRYLPEINERSFSRRSFAERTARNTPIQGSAADIIKLAMLRIYDRLCEKGYAARLVLQVHDELILEMPEEEKQEVTALVKEEMENACDLDVPIKADISYGKDWYRIE